MSKLSNMETDYSFDVLSKRRKERALYTRQLLEETLTHSAATELEKLRMRELLADLWSTLTE